MTTRDIEYHLPRPEFMGPAQAILWHYAERRLKALGAIPDRITVTTYDADFHEIRKMISWANPFLSYGSIWSETVTDFPEETEHSNWIRHREAAARQFGRPTCETISDPHPDLTIRRGWAPTTTGEILDAQLPTGLGTRTTPRLSVLLA
jgi:hypothetical protein